MASPETSESLNEENNEANVVSSEHSHDSQEETETLFHTDEEQKERLTKLPLGRIRTIIKTDPDVNLINQEAVFLIAKSTELFIDSLAKEAYKYSALTKKRSVQKKDVESAIDNVDALVFLEGMLD